ncbi:hypothetical protein LCGC14_2903840, partial [marine sediment metagenome]
SRTMASAIIREGEGSSSEMGVFGAVLASDGEATDGHILHIPGNRTPARMPLLFGHRSEAMVPSLGSVSNPKKGRSADGKNRVLRTKQTINMKGEGQMLEIRRNIALLVHDGDINAMSVRWVPEEVTRRIELPRNHYAYVDPAEESKDSERYWGYFHAKSRNEEGSIVAIGADPKALVGRAQELKGHASAIFFRALARSVEKDVDGFGELGVAFDAYTEALSSMRKAGFSDEDMAIMISSDMKPIDMVLYEVLDEGGSRMSISIPRIVRDSILCESMEAYAAAVSLQREVLDAKAKSDNERDTAEPMDYDLTPEEQDAIEARIYPRSKKVIHYTPVCETPSRTIADLDPEEFTNLLGSAIGTHVRQAMAQATGRILE